MDIFFVFLFALPSVLTILDFIYFLIYQKRLYRNTLNRGLEVATILILPVLFLAIIDESKNDCCTGSAVFSPEHKLSIYLVTAFCVLAYFYSTIKTKISSPIIEVLMNSLLLLGVVFNIFIAIHVKDIFWFFGNLPICLLFILQLIENQKRFLQSFESVELSNPIEKLAYRLLGLPPIMKFPILLILCLPVLILISSLLLLFGQKPDSIVRAFTDTYKHGFSQLDYLCDNVNCGGHFLCSVAANGHKTIVRPVRYGERRQRKIICNRQLLIANAVEELLEQKLPKIHKIIRHNYNHVGNQIHRHYYVFNNKLVADFVYILMKPLELFFLLALYTCDQKPENRISQQYLSSTDREVLNKIKNIS